MVMSPPVLPDAMVDLRDRAVAPWVEPDAVWIGIARLGECSRMSREVSDSQFSNGARMMKRFPASKRV